LFWSVSIKIEGSNQPIHVHLEMAVNRQLCICAALDDILDPSSAKIIAMITSRAMQCSCWLAQPSAVRTRQNITSS